MPLRPYLAQGGDFFEELWRARQMLTKCQSRANVPSEPFMTNGGLTKGEKMDIRGSLPEIIKNEDNLYEGDLIHYFREIFKHAKNLANPYHNFRHLFHTFYLCYEACIYYAGEMTPREMRNLLIAALFHDFDHPGRTGNDDLNIEIALRGLRKHILPEDQGHLDTISSLIWATEYPYAVPTAELNLGARILRDADGSQALSIAWIQQTIFGLAAEMSLSPQTVLSMQEKFLSNLEFGSAWAKEKFNHGIVEAKIDEAVSLLALLEE